MIGLVLTAAGSGRRFGDPTPKQFHRIEGVPIFALALRPFLSRIDEAVVVVPEGWTERTRRELETHDLEVAHIRQGGAERQDSVERGLKALAPEISTVLVHDGARPFVKPELIDRVLDGLVEYDGCIPGLAVTETVKEVADNYVLRTLDRNVLRLIQTPQAFRREVLSKAFKKARRDSFRGTDEASLVERLGGRVVVVEGDPGNKKLTYPQDLCDTG